MTRYTSESRGLHTRQKSTQSQEQLWPEELPPLWKCPIQCPIPLTQETASSTSMTPQLKRASPTTPFFMGASNDNLDEVLKNRPQKVYAGVKVFFMGSSTGNMLVDNQKNAGGHLWPVSPTLIATHCESETHHQGPIPKKGQSPIWGKTCPMDQHPIIPQRRGPAMPLPLFAVELAPGPRVPGCIFCTSLPPKELSLFDTGNSIEG